MVWLVVFDYFTCIFVELKWLFNQSLGRFGFHRRIDEISDIVCTWSCQNDNFRYSQWLYYRQNDDISISVIRYVGSTSFLLFYN